MIPLFRPDDYVIDTSKFSNFLHDKVVNEFESNFAEYVGAKYACTINSATNAIFLLFLNKNLRIKVPSMIPPVVLNALITSGNSIEFIDDTNWIGNSYVLHQFEEYKIIDSAQKVDENQFKNEANPGDIMFFSHYPTKPVGSCDGGTIVTDDYEKIKWLKEAVLNGMSWAENNWDRKIKFPGYKMYMNSLQAYIANENLKKIDENKYRLKKIRDFYNEKFGYKNVSDHLYRIEVDNNKKFIEYMKLNGIICGIHYDNQHDNIVYTNETFDCPDSIIKSRKTVSIPFHQNLTDSEIQVIVDNILKYNEK
jgi:dTDP-4-amino-4,6-dideoxygalactose transaminase